MDINLPGLSGTEAMKILRADPSTAHIPIIALSANAVPRDIEKALEAGFFNYITKPIIVEPVHGCTRRGTDLFEKSIACCRRTGAAMMINAAEILNARILIVDDQAVNVSLLEQMLLEAGYVTWLRPEPAGGLRVASQERLRPDPAGPPACPAWTASRSWKP